MKNHDLILEVLSRISDSTLDEVSKMRAELACAGLRPQKRPLPKRWVMAGAISALAAILLAVFLPIILLYDPTRPVYNGMSVASAKTEQSPEAGVLSSPKLFGNTDGSGSSEDGGNTKDGKNEGNGESGDNEPTEPDDLLGEEVGNAGISYYCNPGDDILIHIHLTNPESYEILSFTLNGVKYTSYMFEYGSTMETLILKTNVGDTAGIKDYTIDAIKYVDGEQIKDVRMDGERTVRVGVSVAAEELPSAEIGSSITDNVVQLTVELSDPWGLILSSGGSAYAALCRGDEIVEQQPLALGANTVSFTLADNEVYSVRVVGVYDNMMGSGTCAHVMYDKTLITTPCITPENVTVGDEEISFTLNTDRADKASFISTELLEYGEVIETSTDPSQLAFALTDNSGMFRIRVNYSYTGEDGTVILASAVSDIAVKDLLLPFAGYVHAEYSPDVPIPSIHPHQMFTHNGLDINTSGELDLLDISTYPLVHAVRAGVVTELLPESFYCWHSGGSWHKGVAIISDDGYEIRYYGLMSTSLKVGDRVELGDLIGTASVDGMGFDGGPIRHYSIIHIEVRRGGVLIDPMEIMKLK